MVLDKSVRLIKVKQIGSLYKKKKRVKTALNSPREPGRNMRRQGRGDII